MFGKENLFFVSDEICQITSERLNQFTGLLAAHKTLVSSKPISFLNPAKIIAAFLSKWDCTFFGHLDFFLYELPVHITSTDNILLTLGWTLFLVLLVDQSLSDFETGLLGFEGKNYSICVLASSFEILLTVYFHSDGACHDYSYLCLDSPCASASWWWQVVFLV